MFRQFRFSPVNVTEQQFTQIRKPAPDKGLDLLAFFKSV
jgi:hypothetical protein